MYLYIILKIILEVYGIYLNKNFKNYILIIESIIIAGYFYLLYLNEININRGLFIWCSGWIIFFVSYKSINYLYENRSKILCQIKQKVSEEKIKKIKEFFLKPIVCDVIYYLIWMLPWNIGYWIYFYIMENGWYWRVWINSTRDVVLWKIFKWDSRMFFFELNKKIHENKIILIIWEIKEFIVKGFLRILILISYLREKILKVTIIEYLVNRLLVFCYLSMFYLYMIEGIQIINKLILILFLLMYILIFFFFNGFFNYFNEKNKEVWEICEKVLGQRNLYLILDPLTHNYYLSERLPIEQNNMIWNKTLGNSISLNILNEYMLYVNKNTKGYYYYKYGILTKIKSVKIYEVSNIPWNIIPQTRRVIMQMRYFKKKLLFFLHEKEVEPEFFKENFQFIKETNSFFMENFIIKNFKNFYLSFSEKTYNEVSFLYMLYLMKQNYDVNSMMISKYYYRKINRELIKDKKYYFFDDMLFTINLHKSNIWKLCLIDINKKDNKILNIIYICSLFFFNSRFFDILSRYLMSLKDDDIHFNNINFDNIVQTEIKYASLKKYKENIKILTHFELLEEEGIVWNKELMEYLNEIEKLKQNIEIKKKYYISLIELSKDYQVIKMALHQTWTTQEILKLVLIEDLGVKFNFDINKLFDEKSILDKVQELKNRENKVIEIENEFMEKGVLKELEEIVKDLENLNIEEKHKFRADSYYNEELFDKQYKKYIKNMEEKEKNEESK